MNIIITPVLKSLHWLPVQQRIRFKLGLLVYKTVNSGQPQYLKSVLIPQTYHYSMRSSDHLCLVKNCSWQTSFFSIWTYFLELSSCVCTLCSVAWVISFAAENLPLSNCVSTVVCLSVSYGLIFWILT